MIQNISMARLVEGIWLNDDIINYFCRFKNGKSDMCMQE